jgi:hypothetical protein
MIYSDHPSRFRAREFMASLDPSNGILLVRDIENPRNYFIVEPDERVQVIHFTGAARIMLPFPVGLVRNASKGFTLALSPKGHDRFKLTEPTSPLVDRVWKNEWITVKGDR